MGPTRILLVLTRTLGDVVLIHNLVDGCIKKFGDCHITVVVESIYANILEGNTKINKIITGNQWHTHWNDIIDMAISKEFDEVMIPQQLHAEDNVWHQLEEYRRQHLVDFYLQRCRLPQRSQDEKLQIYPDDNDVSVAEAFIDKDIKYVVMHTKSLADGKDWDKFNALHEAVKSKGIMIIQVGAKTDPLLANDGVGFIDARESLSFKQIAALCSKSLCFVGLDSGLSYIAAASGCKTIVIQGSTIPQTSGPWGDNVINVLAKTRTECEKVRCHGNCKYKAKCISNITLEDVLKHIF